MGLQPTRGTYPSGTIVKLTNCSYYSVKNLATDEGLNLLIKNTVDATAAESTTIPPSSSDSSLWQNFNMSIYGDVFLDGTDAGFTIECSPGTVAEEV